MSQGADGDKCYVFCSSSHSQVMVTNTDLLDVRAGNEGCTWEADLPWAWPVNGECKPALDGGLSGIIVHVMKLLLL